MIFVCCFVWANAFAQESFLTQDEKNQRRLQFNQYVETELAKVQQSSLFNDPDRDAWDILVGAQGGYENNVNLDAEREGDFFHEEFAEITRNFSHEGVGDFFGTGFYGAGLNTNYRSYGDEDTLDYHITTGRLFGESQLTPDFILDS